MGSYCKIRKEGKIAVITLMRQQLKNKLNIPFMEELAELFDSAAADCTSLVIEAEGNYFCAGGELGDFRVTDSMEVLKFTEALKNLVVKLAKLPIPIFAAIEGDVEGGGINLLEACDIAVASENCLFSIPEMKRGISPVISFVGASRVLPKKKLMELALFSSKLTALEAFNTGLINLVVKKGDAVQTCIKMAHKLLGLNPTSISVCKRLLCRTSINEFEKKMSEACDILVLLLMSDNAREALNAEQEGRIPNYKTI